MIPAASISRPTRSYVSLNPSRRRAFLTIELPEPILPYHTRVRSVSSQGSRGIGIGRTTRSAEIIDSWTVSWLGQQNFLSSSVRWNASRSLAKSCPSLYGFFFVSWMLPIADRTIAGELINAGMWFTVVSGVFRFGVIKTLILEIVHTTQTNLYRYRVLLALLASLAAVPRSMTLRHVIVERCAGFAISIHNIRLIKVRYADMYCTGVARWWPTLSVGIIEEHRGQRSSTVMYGETSITAKVFREIAQDHQ